MNAKPADSNIDRCLSQLLVKVIWLYQHASCLLWDADRFEQLALEYDSDEIGELEQLEGHPSLQGTATTDRFSEIMDQFLAVHNTQDHNHDSGHAYRSAAQMSAGPGESALAASACQESTPQDSAHSQAAASKQLSSSAANEAEKAAAMTALARVDLHFSHDLKMRGPTPEGKRVAFPAQTASRANSYFLLKFAHAPYIIEYSKSHISQVLRTHGHMAS